MKSAALPNARCSQLSIALLLLLCVRAQAQVNRKTAQNSLLSTFTHSPKGGRKDCRGGSRDNKHEIT
jgi:hypothetical protein